MVIPGVDYVCLVTWLELGWSWGSTHREYCGIVAEAEKGSGQGTLGLYGRHSQSLSKVYRYSCDKIFKSPLKSDIKFLIILYSILT